MDIYEAFVSKAIPISVEPEQTSYFSREAPGLDPRLFYGATMVPSVRSSILRILFEHLGQQYSSPETYIHVWLAGSGVSHQWTAARTPADLDCLVGVNYLLFRSSNQQYKALSDKQISAMLNQDFRDLNKTTANFLDSFELTFYANVNADIKAIKPYAAYSVTNDDWTVRPEIKGQPKNKAGELKAAKDVSMANEIIDRYTKALTSIQSSKNDVARRNAEAALKLAVEQGASLFEEIHDNRKMAFSPSGQGYLDIHNYRWQAGKSSGAIRALRKLKDIKDQGKASFETATYGMELPNPDVLIRRAIGGK